LLENKNVTIMVVPDRKSRVFKVTLTAGRLKLFLWLGALGVVYGDIGIDIGQSVCVDDIGR
jgi:hypothetical protein